MPGDASRQPSSRLEGPVRPDYSEIAGPIEDLPHYRGYRVGYRRLRNAKGITKYLRPLFVAGVNLLLETVFLVWLLQPSHFANVSQTATAADIFVIASIALMELLRLINVISLSVASLVARDPIPVRPERGLRVAFVTAMVPSKEPIEMVRNTLRAARRVRHDGIIDVWLLDEGNDDNVKRMCAQLGVYHFSRKGIPEFNQPKGAFKAKTKHGNYNSWLKVHGHKYAIMMSVDSDHVPLSNYADRVLGYFRDPDVAYVVGPQAYANCDNFVTKAAESQQFPFHSIIQRAANMYNAAMLVGTNNAIRIEAIVGIGGLADSITEDMATGLKMHTSRNPRTGKRWKSVYTPDLLAIGEGPSSWSDYFSQQLRWSRGTFEILLTDMWKYIWKLTPGRLVHYLLITTFYPSMAIGWLLGGVNAVLFLVFGTTGISVPLQIWFALYVDATIFQMWLYIRAREYNVSPSEAEGSTGVVGMLMSVLVSPMFASSLISTLLRRPAKFVVTAKGDASSGDGWFTFRRHLQWAVLLIGALTASVVLGYASPEACLWPVASLIVCLTPIVLWRVSRRRERKGGGYEPPRDRESQGKRLSATEVMQTGTRIVRHV
jgi:cellulose synthase/poly-beta-1,6-N-acetylglucosamine synthase-like glycosyltransferase